MPITIRRKTVDGINERRVFKTTAGARAYLVKWVGETPETSERFNYAVDNYGVQVLRVEGIPVADLVASR